MRAYESKYFCITENTLFSWKQSLDSQMQHFTSDSKGWKDIHESGWHRLAICYMEETVRIVEEYHLSTVLEALSVSVEERVNKSFLVFDYCPPKQQIRTFIDKMISSFNEIWKVWRIIKLGEFNFDQNLFGQQYLTNFDQNEFNIERFTCNSATQI